MKIKGLMLFTLFVNLLFAPLESLNRDYSSNFIKDYCSCHLPENQLKEGMLRRDLVELLPCEVERYCSHLKPVAWSSTIKLPCFNSPIYTGYVDPNYRSYAPHLIRHLEYCQKYLYRINCTCYWPEYSQQAAQISDDAYLLFRDLIATTSLSKLLEDDNEQCNFLNKCKNPDYILTLHGLSIAFIAKQLHFIDYCSVCRDIEDYATSKYSEKQTAEIKDKLQDILEVLYPKFFSLYASCYEVHPTSEIAQEIRFMKLFANDLSGFEEMALSEKFCMIKQYSDDLSELIIADVSTAKFPVELESENLYICSLPTQINSDDIKAVRTFVFSPQSDILLEQGALLNDYLIYKEAIKVLTQAILLNPSNRNAYIERAMAYFETDQLELAIMDYESAKRLTVVPPFKPGSYEAIWIRAVYTPENKIEFANGLLSGTLEGGKISAIEFIPSIFSSCKGILNGLWSFVCSPKEVSQEIIDTAYSIGEFISSHSTMECLKYVVPELKELSHTWDKLNDYSRGHKIGFIVGKYGLEIFAPIGTLKGIAKLKAMRRANTMFTLENCAFSQARRATILEESTRRSAFREGAVVDAIKNGKILTKSSNVQYHVMQPKHSWDKVIKLSGNVEEDFKKCILLLEQESIFNKKYFLTSKEFSAGKIISSEYKKVINGQKIKAIFRTYTETNQTFLQDAWVVTR